MSIPKNETQLVCVAQFWAKEGEATKLVENLRTLIPLTRVEGGCIRYELNIDHKDDHHIVFIEKFSSKQTFDEHCNKKYIKDFFHNGERNPDHVDRFQVDTLTEVLW